MIDTCRICGAPVSADEIGLTRKLFGRAATEYLCLDCIAEHFKVPRENLLIKIEQYRENGCTLFPPKD